MDTINPVLERITRDLPCELTHADLVRAVKDLGAVLEATAHEEARQKAAKKEMASKLAELEMQRQELGAKITTGRELRPVSVEVVADYEKGTAQEIRTDTYEVVITRPLSWDEKQLGLPKLDTSPVVAPPPIAGPLLESCEMCGHGRGDHPEPGPCLSEVSGVPCGCPTFIPFGQTPDVSIVPVTSQNLNTGSTPPCSWCGHPEFEHEPVKTDGTNRICLHESCTCGDYEVESPVLEVPVAVPAETSAVDPAPAEVEPPSEPAPPAVAPDLQGHVDAKTFKRALSRKKAKQAKHAAKARITDDIPF